MAEEILDSVGTDNEFMFQLKQAQSLFTNIDSYKSFMPQSYPRLT